MMKNILYLFLILFTVSCGSNNEEEQASKEEKKVSKRNHSITEANSFNSIFFDSLQLVRFMDKTSVPDSLRRRMISFYNTRNYQYAWFYPDGLTEQALGFWNLHTYHTTYDDDSVLNDLVLEKRMRNYTSETDGFKVNGSDTSVLDTELRLTRNFILYLLGNVEKGYIKRKEMERFVPAKREDPVYLADSLVNKKHKDNKYYGQVNRSYGRMMEQIARYLAITRAGGWPEVPAGVIKLKEGDSSASVAILKKRLLITGDMPADSSPVYNAALKEGIDRFLSRYGYSPAGKLNDPATAKGNEPRYE